MNQDLSRVNDLIGTFEGVDHAPLAGSVSFTLVADMDPSQIHDSTNWIDLVIQAQSAGTWQEVARYSQTNGAPWQGGPSAIAPTLTYLFPVNASGQAVPPPLIRGVLLNGAKGAGSPAVCGLQSAFN